MLLQHEQMLVLPKPNALKSIFWQSLRSAILKQKYYYMMHLPKKKFFLAILTLFWTALTTLILRYAIVLVKFYQSRFTVHWTIDCYSYSQFKPNIIKTSVLWCLIYPEILELFSIIGGTSCCMCAQGFKSSICYWSWCQSRSNKNPCGWLKRVNKRPIIPICNTSTLFSVPKIWLQPDFKLFFTYFLHPCCALAHALNMKYPQIKLKKYEKNDMAISKPLYALAARIAHWFIFFC